jgi:hypothetical protein
LSCNRSVSSSEYPLSATSLGTAASLEWPLGWASVPE